MDAPIRIENGATNSPRSQALIESLQAQLHQLQETNFELQASLATMQAEQSFSIQQMEAKYKEENTTLQNALRLQQQTTQRLLQQQSKRPRTETDPFQRRLPTSRDESAIMATAATANAPTSPELPPEIIIDGQGTSTVDPKPSPRVIPRNKTNQSSDAKILAQNLLYHVPSPDASPKIHNFLLQVATSDRDAWTECLLVEFLLQQPNGLLYWQQALLWSRAARQGILHAMQQLENDDDEDGNHIPTTRTDRPCRIHRLNPDRSLGEPVSTCPPLFTMNPQIVKDWIGNRLDRRNPQHLQLLAMVLDDCPSHTTNIWWRFLLPGVTTQLVQLHAEMTNQKLPTNEPSSHGRRTTKHRWSDLGPSRRLRFQSPSSYSTTDQSDDLLLACMTLMERLVSVTRVDTLERWYSFTTQGPKQPFAMEDLTEASEESALLWVGLLLDILEGLECFQYDKALVLPGWYLQMIYLLAAIGQTTWGMKVLRTRLRDSSGGDHLPNAVDAAIVQLFHLSLMDAHDVIDYLDPAHQQRLQVMDCWVRFIHQVLLFVQQQETAVITFRSLILELHEHYTCACTRILTDP